MRLSVNVIKISQDLRPTAEYPPDIAELVRKAEAAAAAAAVSVSRTTTRQSCMVPEGLDDFGDSSDD